MAKCLLSQGVRSAYRLLGYLAPSAFPLELGPKEGLALINGTQFIAAHAVNFMERFQNCLDHADIIAAMNLEAMLGSVKAFDP